MKNNPLFTFKSGASIGVFNAPNNSLIFINELLGKSKIIIKKDNQNISKPSTISDFLVDGNYSELHFNTGLSKIKQSGKVGYRLLSSESSKYNKIGVGAVDFTAPGDEADVKVGSSGNNSFSEGKGNISSGDGSHTEGGHNKASGLASHAEGFGNIASGYMAHAEGSGTLAAGTMSHTSGFKTQALEKILDTGIYEDIYELNNSFDKRIKLINVFLGGIKSQPIDLNAGESICCGIHTQSKNTKLFLYDSNGQQLSSDNSHGDDNEWMHIISYVNNTNDSQEVEFHFKSEDDNFIGSLGQYMYIYLSKTNIIDYDTVVEEFDATYTQVEDTKTVGNIASGFETISLGNVSHAEGWKTRSFGGYGSHSEGYLTTALGSASHSEGYSTSAIGVISHSEGYLTSAIGDISHSEGYLTTAIGNISHSEGYLTSAIGVISHSEGCLTTAIGVISHSEGCSTSAIGFASHSEGYLTAAEGYASHAEGRETHADGYQSHAEGLGTIAQNISSHASGKYNVGTSADTIHETGIGPGTNDRKNGFEIYTDGTLTAPECTNDLIDSRGDKTLVTKEYVVFNESNFDGVAGDTAFTILGKLFSKAYVYLAGVKLRDTAFTITDNGSDTTITLTDALADDAWIAVEYI